MTTINISVPESGRFINANKRGQTQVIMKKGIAGVLEDVPHCPIVPTAQSTACFENAN